VAVSAHGSARERGARSYPHPHCRRQEPRQGTRAAYGAGPPFPHPAAAAGSPPAPCGGRDVESPRPQLYRQHGHDFEVQGMSAVTLHRIDAARRMSRFYRLDVQPDLFGQWCFMREWGRIGQGGQMRETPYQLRPRQRPPWRDSGGQRNGGAIPALAQTSLRRECATPRRGQQQAASPALARPPRPPQRKGTALTGRPRQIAAFRAA
jgi:WGR domain